MTTDQPRLAHSRLLVGKAFARYRAADPEPDPHDAADWLLQQLQTAGWKAPPDPTVDIPPLRPDQPADEDSPGRREFAEARAQLAARRSHHDTRPESVQRPT